MSKTFIFQTGHAKGLAKAEILALLGSSENPNPIIDEVMDGFVLEAEIPNPVTFLNRMGGIVRIMEVIRTGPASMPLNFEEWVTEAVASIASKGSKIRYGLSLHPKSEKILKKILIGSKKSLKESGNVRFINKDFQNLSSVQAWHEKLLAENAIELHLFKSESEDRPKWYLAKTVAIQDFEAYSFRDYERPARSAANGMFPPKLAQILINLAAAQANTSDQTHTSDQTSDVRCIYDPFCGSGTVLQEAWLMGYMTWGSDIAEQMIVDSQKNLEWLSTCKLQTCPGNSWVHPEPQPANRPKLFVADATQLTTDQIPSTSFAIVTETWLGPVLTKPPTHQELQKIHREVEALYEAFFVNLKNLVLGPNAPSRTKTSDGSQSSLQPITVVFTAPYHREGNMRHFLPNLPAILAKYAKIIPLSDHERPSLFFERKNQLVSREIWKVTVSR